MNRKTFCPFINGNCVDECMFHTISSLCNDDNCNRNCLIAKSLSEFPDSKHQEDSLEAILTALKHH